MMIATTTNHLEKLDGGLANHLSRFDRKYNFPVPSYEKRMLYSEFWRRKLRRKEAVDFSKGLDSEIASIIEDF
jgi:transitional endoplasmic reticulum ATPase